MKDKKHSLLLVLAAVGVFCALSLGSSPQQTAEEVFEKALYLEEGKGDLQEAVGLYQQVLKKFPQNRDVAAKAQLHIGLCYEKLGMAEAVKAFQSVIDQFPEQAETVRAAREKLVILQRAQAMIAKEARGLQVRQVWSESGTDILGAVSPDGRYISFVDWNTGDLAIRELAGGKKQRLTDKGSWLKSQEFALFSKWSPDSKKVAYSWFIKDNYFDLRVVDIQDRQPRVLYSRKELEYVHPFDWAPDGKSILTGFFRGGDTIEIGLLFPEDSTVKIIKTFHVHYADSQLSGFAFSPDGRCIAYDLSRENSQNRDIFLLSSDGTRESVLIEHPAFEYVLDWSPDGRYLLFASNRTGQLGVWLQEIEGDRVRGEPRLVKDGIGNLEPMGITRAGEFYFGVTGAVTDLYEVSLDPGTGKVLSPPAKIPLFYEGRNSLPDYSPDGKELAYVSTRGYKVLSNNVLCIRSLETGKVREFGAGMKDLSYPQWSPDGRSILMRGRDAAGQNGIFRVDAQTGALSPVIQVGQEITVFSARWSRDGKAIFFTKSTGAASRPASLSPSHIFIFNLETGEEKMLPGSPSDALDIEISPDGRLIVLLNRHGKRSLRVIPAEGGEVREVCSFEQLGNFPISPAWSADSRFIFFYKDRSSGERPWDMWRVSADGGEPQKLELEMADFYYLGAHPDGRRLVFHSHGKTPRPDAIWVMENFLPK